MRKTKIIATMGPASSPKHVLKEMFQQGLNVCRMNFSHGSHEDHAEVIKTVRDLNSEMGLNVAILADLQGPKIRTGEMEGNGVQLITGSKVSIVTKQQIGTGSSFSINYSELPKDVKADERILLDDGKLVLKIISTNGEDRIETEVVHGGILSSHKGVNLPNTKISMPCLTEKDLEDLSFALEQSVDWIGLSFVRSSEDIQELRSFIEKTKSKAKIIAKIEKPEALKDIDRIIDESDALMVARGDLGVEIPYQNVPLIQKMIITKCIQHARPVIVATQMMESMISSISPTRAEVNDVANAVLDGADAVMLSGETSVGDHPIEVIKTMAAIVEEMEGFDGMYFKEEVPKKNEDRFITDSICFNACRLARRVEAKAILTMSFTGYTGYKISSQRPNSDIFVFTSNRKILNQVSLIWGVQGFYYNKKTSTDDTISDIKEFLKEKNILEGGDIVINIASMPIKANGNSNMLKLSYVE
jgi:pyruvate kinase